MFRYLFLCSLLGLVGCSGRGSSFSDEPEVRIEEFCRGDLSATTRVRGLVEEGWQYQGPLHQNGLNCYAILFVR